VYSIPSISQILNAGTPNEMKDLSRHDWLPSLQIPGAKFDPNQFIPLGQQCVVDSDANMIPSNERLVDDIVHVGSKKKRASTECTLDLVKRNNKINSSSTKETNITLLVHTQLHEFVLKVAIPSNNVVKVSVRYYLLMAGKSITTAIATATETLDHAISEILLHV
jgi:hypothetical protein